eukprot:1232014-Amphidinium_carterae.1
METAAVRNMKTPFLTKGVVAVEAFQGVLAHTITFEDPFPSANSEDEAEGWAEWWTWLTFSSPAQLLGG